MRATTAAVTGALVLSLAACGGGAAPETDPTAASPEPAATSASPSPAPSGTATTPSPDATPASTAAPDVRETTFPAEGLGRGIVVGLSPDTAHAYVVAEHPTRDETGCEGAEAGHLWRVDLASGARVSAVPEADYPIGAAPLSNGRGRALLAEECEGYLVRLHVASQDLDGRLADLTEVAVDDDLDAQPYTFTWDRAGERILFTTSAAFSKDERTSQVHALDPATGEATPIVDLPFAGRVHQLEDGRYVVESDGDVVIVTATGQVQTRYEGYSEVAVGPDGTLALAGRDAGLALAPPGGRADVVGDGEVWELRWSPTGDALSYLTDTGGSDDFELALEVVDVEGKRRERVKDVGFSGGFFDRAGARLVYTATDGGFPSGVPTVRDL